MPHARVALAAAASLLSACVSPGIAPSVEGRAAAEAAWNQRIASIEAANGFVLLGRLAVKGGGLSGSLRWQQDGTRFNLRLTGPFGVGALTLDGDDRLVAIKSKNIDLVTAEPEAVLAARTGWRLPLNALHYWVLGIPAPQSAADVALDADGRALSLQQAGWSIRYSDYRDGSPALPGRIEAQREDWTAIVAVESLTLATPTAP